MGRVRNRLLVFVVLIAGVLAAAESPAAALVTPGLITSAPQAGAIGSPIHLTAELQQGDNPTGTIVIELYGPNDATPCTTLNQSVTIPVTNGNAVYSTDRTVFQTGVYRVKVTYTGDGNNNPAGGFCQSFQIAVGKATPTLVGTFDTTDKPVNTLTQGSVTLSGGYNRTGTLALTFHNSDDTDCSGAPFGSFTDNAPSGNPTVLTVSFNPAQAGTYRWKAVYSGDANNNARSIACGNAITFLKATPVLTGNFTTGTKLVGTTAAGDISLAGGFNRTGVVKVELFPPSDTTCSGSPINGSSTDLDHTFDGFDPINLGLTSGALTTTGVYRWKATYAGDTNNAGTSIACGVNSFTIVKATPTISGTATPGTVTYGGSGNDVATVSSSQALTQPVTFKLYANETCTGTPLSTSTGAIVNGSATSATVTPANVGVYHWVASYPGDALNDAVETACLAQSQTLVVNGKPASLSATPNSSQIQRGNTTSVLARVDKNATGTMTFDLYGPGDTTCTGTPVFHGTATMKKGTPTYRSDAVRLTTAGTYRWVVKYSGDNAFAAAASACSAAPVTVR